MPPVPPSATPTPQAEPLTADQIAAAQKSFDAAKGFGLHSGSAVIMLPGVATRLIGGLLATLSSKEAEIERLKVENLERLEGWNAANKRIREAESQLAEATAQIAVLLPQLERFGRLYKTGTLGKTARSHDEWSTGLLTGDNSWVSEARDTCANLPTAATALLRRQEEMREALKEIDKRPFYTRPIPDTQIDGLIDRYHDCLTIARAALSKEGE